MTFRVSTPTTRRLSRRFLATTCLATGLSSLSFTAFAGEAPVIEEIIVTGSVLQNQSEILNRQKSTVIVDTISQDEIGALPDLTIAESMRRITGVTTIYNDDIGQFASIRGVHPDFVPVTVNGLSIATTGDLGEGTRMINLQVIPSIAVKTIEAFKTPTPDQDAGALGGMINLVPISAFDSGVATLSLTAGASYSTYMVVPDDNSFGHSKDSPIGKAFNGMWTQTFGPNEAFGIAVSATYEDRPRTQTNDAITNRLYYTAAGVATNPEAANWNGFAAPNSFLTHNYTNLFQKYGGTVHLQYSPSDSFSTGLYGFLYISDEEETRNSNRIFSLDQPRDLTATTGSMRVRSADTQWRYNTFERDQMGIQWKTQAQLSDRQRLSVNAGYSHARFGSDRPFATFIYASNQRVTYDLNNQKQRFVLDNPSSYVNLSNYVLGETYRDSRDSETDLLEARVDYTFNNTASDRGLGFAAGADVRSIDLERDITSTNYTAGGLTMAGLGYIEEFNYIGYPYPSPWLNSADFWDRAIKNVPVNAALSATNSRISDYRFKEDMYAAYAGASYITDMMNLMGGLRLDHIKADATNAQVIGGVLQPNLVTRDTGYTRLLPYATAVFSLSPEVRIKAGASQTLGRPNPQDVATAETSDTTERTITRGNTDIKPRTSTNFDLGAEYFFNGGDGMVTLTAFYKDIKDDILTVSTQQDIAGEPWTITQPINGEKTTLKGAEFGLVSNTLSFIHPLLTRVGASANLLYVDGQSGFMFQGVRRDRDDLLWLSHYSANGALFYAFDGGSEIRFAVNHKSSYVETYAASPWLDIYIKPFTTVDFTGKWAVTPEWQVRVEGRNITNSNRYRTTGPNHDLYRAGLEIGQTWFLRLSYTR
jgi:iron complex outermembrane receptor protein